MTRYSVELGPEFEQALATLAEDKNSTKAEVIRRALIAYAAQKREEKEGHKVSITAQADPGSQGDRILKDVILP